MSSLAAISPAVASCSRSGAGLKRKHDGDSDDSSDIKLRKGNFYLVLESESEIPSTSDEETESLLSLQNKSTDFAKDTSDTCSKTSHSGSDFEVEFEVVSMSDQEPNNPFDESCSGTDLDTLKKKVEKDSVSDDSDSSSMWADNSSGPEEVHDRFTIPAKLRSCVKCKAPTGVHYCLPCYKVRKDFFPPRPKTTKRKKATKSFLKKKISKEPETSVTELNESGIESGCSQELMTSGDAPDSSVGNDNLCNICLKNQKDGAFLHCRWVHIYACYECSIKTWFTSRRCPLCNGKVNRVLKVAMG